MNNIKVSVIIPAYNIENYIEKSIKSVIEQTLKEIEIIVVNDGSQDGTLKIIENLMKEDKRIILVNKENKGLSAARNTGLMCAKGEYIAHLDGDDWIEKEYLEDTYVFAKSNNLDMVVTDYYEDYGNNKLLYINDLKLENEKIIYGNKYREIVYKNGVSNSVWNKLVKKDLYFNNNIFFLENISMGEDLAVNLRLIYTIEKVGKIEKAYIHYIQRPSSLTKTKNNKAKYLYPYITLFDILKNFLVIRGIYEAEKDKIYNYEVNSLKTFVFQDADWKNKNYINGINRCLELVKDKRMRIAVKNFELKWKVIWYILKTFPFLLTIKCLRILKNR